MIRSLVIAPQWIGDAVMTEPLLRRLLARGEHISVGALPWVAPVYRAMPGVAEVIEFPFAHGGLQWAARRDMAGRLRGRFDVAYVCPNSLKSALIPWWAGIAVRVGYHGESRYGLINRRLPNPPQGQRPPMVPFYAALASPATAPHHNAHDLGDPPRLTLPAQQQSAVLLAHGLQPQGYAVMAPGAEYGPAKRWPVGHFASLAAKLPWPVLLLGSGKEAGLCHDIAQRARALTDAGLSEGRTGVRNLAGKTSLDEALALIAGAALMVSNDSGLMHVAAAFGVRQAAVFGSSSPLHTPPLNERATVLWLKNDPAYLPPLDCAPCFERTCPLGHTRCLNDISPVQVLERLGLTP